MAAPSPDTASDTVDTVVVGAGVAGLTAARLLAGAGQRVVVLEARERVGGRTHSQRDADGRCLDLGASWIHGTTDSPLHDLTSALGMREVELTVGSYQAGGRPMAYFGPDGARLDEERVAAFVQDVATCDEALVAVVADAPAGATYADAVEGALTSLGWTGERASRVREFCHHRAEEQYGVAADRLDAHGLDDDQVDGDEVVFPDGYDRLAAHLAEGLDIRLGHPVEVVRWGATGVELECPDGLVHRAAQAVVTVPVGVIQEGALRFEPPLPAPVTGALEGVRMNAFEKVFLTFPTRFWDDRVVVLRRQGPAATWWHSWYDVSAAHGAPTLLTFAAGPCALAVRSWSDEQVVASVLDALRETHPDAPVPVSTRVTHWRDDPWSRGAYAYLVPGGSTRDHDALATPVAGVLHLAGEATWGDDPATVTAALLSGHRAAERVAGAALPLSDLAGVLGRLEG